ncbi:MAG TPA: alpha/beta hydrolase [Candidatus Limnocylindria bacterium]|nr:alpha/beta hydrolase [Candidatus Limnocylindria bacterium]
MKAVYLPDDRAFLRYVDVPGEDPPLIWLHGWQCSSTGELLPAAVQPPLSGRHSLLVDFLGHGYSDKPPNFDYGLESHARAVVTLIDALGVRDCGLVGHSMGGGVAILVAAARPKLVSLLVMAEGTLGPEGDARFEGVTEGKYVASGFQAMLAAQEEEAAAQPDGLRAVHLGMTRLLEPRAIYREAASMERETDPPLRTLLAELSIPRWYLWGELSDREPEFEGEMASIGVGWRVVPQTGHPMGLQNPLGLAQTVADVVARSWTVP